MAEGEHLQIGQLSNLWGQRREFVARQAVQAGKLCNFWGERGQASPPQTQLLQVRKLPDLRRQSGKIARKGERPQLGELADFWGNDAQTVRVQQQHLEVGKMQDCGRHGGKSIVRQIEYA